MIEINSLNSASSEETARCLFLRGKALNVLPQYDPMAQDALSKAVKMNPKLVEAWNCLGECYWKNRQVEAARNCFVGALNHVSRNSINQSVNSDPTFVSIRRHKLSQLHKTSFTTFHIYQHCVVPENIHIPPMEGFLFFVLHPPLPKKFQFSFILCF